MARPFVKKQGRSFRLINLYINQLQIHISKTFSFSSHGTGSQLSMHCNQWGFRRRTNVENFIAFATKNYRDKYPLAARLDFSKALDLDPRDVLVRIFERTATLPSGINVTHASFFLQCRFQMRDYQPGSTVVSVHLVHWKLYQTVCTVLKCTRNPAMHRSPTFSDKNIQVSTCQCQL